MNTTTVDPHAQLRSLYMALLSRQENFDEFKQLLALYPTLRSDDAAKESTDASGIRSRLNDRIREWVGPFDGLSAAQMLQWRTIVVDERYNVALSPWKESNVY